MMSSIPFIGEAAALGAAMCWTVTAMAFESAGKKVGSLQVNLIRLVIAFFFLSAFSFFMNGFFIPLNIDSNSWMLLLLSGLIGFVIGDLLLFQALVVVGARISMLLMTMAPVFTAVLGWMMLGESLSIQAVAGMCVTIAGVVFVISGKKVKDSRPVTKAGILLGLGGAFGQAAGLILSKMGMKDYSAVSSTQIRVIAGIIGFSLIFTVLKRWNLIFDAVKHIPAMKRITTGAFFGPFMGVSFSLLAVQNTHAGIAATLMSITPVLIIAPSRFIFKEKITFREITGAFIAFCGVALMFLSGVVE